MYNKLLRYTFVVIFLSLRTSSTVKSKISPDSVASNNMDKKKSKNVFKRLKNKISKIIDKLVPDDKIAYKIKERETNFYPKTNNIINVDRKTKLLEGKRCHCIDTANCSNCNALFNRYNEVDKVQNIERNFYIIKLDKIEELKIAENTVNPQKIKVISDKPNQDVAHSVSEYVKNPIEKAEKHIYRDCFSKYGLRFNKYGTPLPVKECKSYGISCNISKGYVDKKANAGRIYPKQRKSRDSIKENIELYNVLNKKNAEKDCGLTNSSSSRGSYGNSRRVKLQPKKKSSKKDISADIKILFFNNKKDSKSINQDESKVETKVYCDPKKNYLLLNNNDKAEVVNRNLLTKYNNYKVGSKKGGEQNLLTKSSNATVGSKEVVNQTLLSKYNTSYFIISIIFVIILVIFGYLALPHITELVVL